ncbi:MAG TPA: DUF5675 family protein [Steroidobacteraceae bacterium]|nr:DUF5675 family protein [Steroidobacteraceae bacterium]
MNLTLRSTSSRGDIAQVGTLAAGNLTLSTIELPWRDNLAGRSCVPAGDYELLPYLSPKHGQTWRLHNPALGVWGRTLAPEGVRTEIEIHCANFARELQGCIAVGLSGEPMLDGAGDGCTHQVEPAVQNSREAFERLRELLMLSENDIHQLTIIRDAITAPREG